MIVEVDNMTYHCDIPVEVGDAVRVELSPIAQLRWGVTFKDGHVTRIGSDYTGPIVSRVLERLEVFTEYDRAFLGELLRRVEATAQDDPWGKAYMAGLVKWCEQLRAMPNDHPCRIGWKTYTESVTQGCSDE